MEDEGLEVGEGGEGVGGEGDSPPLGNLELLNSLAGDPVPVGAHAGVAGRHGADAVADDARLEVGREAAPIEVGKSVATCCGRGGIGGFGDLLSLLAATATHLCGTHNVGSG